ncbi:MAG: type II secretion system major pseudopilin GspG [Kiritimatiellia bacterium]
MKRRKGGFTFMEVMVVLLIIGLITAVVGPNIYGMFKKSQRKTALIQLQELHRSLKLFKMDQGRFPSEAEGLQALVVPPAGLPKPDEFPPDGGYLGGALPLDPWGSPYAYFCPGRQGAAYELVSQGEDPDRENDDIVSPPPDAPSR